jgi:hypothetical protein
MHIILAYIWSKNPVLSERLKNQFGEVQLAEMFSKLDKGDIALGDAMQRAATKYYPAANREFIKKYGIEMPKVYNYFPSKSERISEVDLLNDFMQKSTSPSFVKQRSSGNKLLMDFGNPVQMLYQHVDKMGRFTMMTEKLDMFNQVFKNPEIKRMVSQKYGEGVYRSMLQMLASSSYTQKGVDYDGSMGIINNMVNNWVVTNIALKPTIAFKQLLSSVNYAENMPFIDWQIGYIKALLNPKKTINFMKKNQYLQARFETGGQAEFLEETIKSSRFAKTKSLRDWFTLNIRIGDTGAIVFGGKPYVDYLMEKKGLTEEEAFKEFRLATLRAQQANVPSSLSNFQNSFKNPVIRLLFAYRNTSNQYARKMADSIISYANGDINKKQMAKDLFIYGFWNSFLYKSATSLSIVGLLMTGNDDDLIADIIQSIFDLNSSAIPLLDGAYQYALAELTGQKGFEPKIPIMSDIIDAIRKFADGVELTDFLNVIGVVFELTLGLPAKTVGSMASGIYDMTQEEAGKGLLKVAGYTDYRANRAVNDTD